MWIEQVVFPTPPFRLLRQSVAGCAVIDNLELQEALSHQDGLDFMALLESKENKGSKEDKEKQDSWDRTGPHPRTPLFELYPCESRRERREWTL